MADHSTLDYPSMMVDALRAVVRRSLRYAADHGLPGAHHFYIAFDTLHEGVSMPASLLDRYPQAMTIVLQHDYSALECDDEGFSVILRFGGRPANLSIPFDAVLSFSDPSAEFELVFPMPPRLVLEQAERATESDQEPADETVDGPTRIDVATLASARQDGARQGGAREDSPFRDDIKIELVDDENLGDDGDDDDEPAGPSNVVSFDRTRRRR